MAVISGRPIAQIDEFLQPLQLAVAGVHGSERRGADGEMHLLHTHPLDHVEAAARRWPRHPGCWWRTSAAPRAALPAAARAGGPVPGRDAAGGRRIARPDAAAREDGGRGQAGRREQGPGDRGLPGGAAVRRPPRRSSSATTSPTRSAFPPCSGSAAWASRWAKAPPWPGSACPTPATLRRELEAALAGRPTRTE